MKTDTHTEILEDIYTSYENGNFSQAREEIAEALENGYDLASLLHGDGDSFQCYTISKRFNKFFWLTACQYLASNKASSEAKENVKNW
jgi:hypothetical protein